MAGSTRDRRLRQLSAGEINNYSLDATTPSDGVLSGLEDRLALLP